MPTLLTQLATLFDALGWRYRLQPDQDRLSIRFHTPRGDVSLAIYAPAEETLVFEALRLATLDSAHTEVLATLAQCLPEHLTLTRQPDDGKVCLRLLVPVPGASLKVKALHAALDLLLEIAPVLRAALLLVQQGIPLEEALQRAQAEPAPEAVETSSAMPEALQTLLQELVELQAHNDRSSLELKRALCQTILAQVQRQGASELWAAIQEELGNTCQSLYDMTGAQTHAQAAAEAYQAALTVYTRDSLPTDWATTQSSLATLYTKRYDRRGEERWATLAAEAFQAALTVHTRDALPTDWAMTQSNLAILYASRYDRRGEERWATLAAEAFQAVLTVHTRDALPTDWATTQSNLAILYARRYERSGEECWATLAAEAFQAVLTVYTRDALPTDWATTQSNLANLYQNRYDRSVEERWATLAAEAFQAALTVRTRDALPTDWAMTQSSLATLYTRRYNRRGEECWATLAAEAFQAALTVHTRDALPTDWAMTQHNLATLYASRYDRSGEERWATLAAEACQAALTVCTRDALPTDWARTQHNLANLYQRRYDRSGEERWATLAAEAYQAALTVHTRDALPTDWATTQHNLASLYQSRYDQSGEERWATLAAEAYQAALTVHTRDALPTDWATTQHNLANLYASRYGRSGEERWATLAAEAYQAARTVRTRDALPTDWAMTQNNLANLYARRYGRSGEERWATLAAEAYQAARTVRTRDALPTDWATTQNNLANLYASRYGRSGEERWATLAAEAYQAALAILTLTVAPAMALRTGRSLAGLYSRLRRWDEAHAVYTIALNAADNQYLAAPGENERRRVMADYTELCSADASCLLHLQQPAQAWICLESGRARVLGESLGLEALAALHHGATAVDELRTRRRAVQQADQALHRAEARFLVASTPAEQQAATTERSQARRTLETAYTALRESIARLGLPEPTALDAATLVELPFPPHTAVVTLLLTPETCQALILYAGTVRPVALPAAFTLAEMRRLVQALPPEVEGWIDTYNARAQTQEALAQAQADAQADLQAARRAVEEAETAWRAALETMAVQGGTSQVGWYFAYRLAYEVVRGERHPQAERARLDVWKQTVADTHTFLVTHLWQPLAAALPADVTQVVFVPTGPTALLPVHAAAPDHLTVAYAPSLRGYPETFLGKIRRFIR